MFVSKTAPASRRVLHSLDGSERDVRARVCVPVRVCLFSDLFNLCVRLSVRVTRSARAPTDQLHKQVPRRELLTL